MLLLPAMVIRPDQRLLLVLREVASHRRTATVLPRPMRVALEEGMQLNGHLKNVTADPSVRFKAVASALLGDIALMADVAGQKPATQRGVDAYW